MTSSLLGGKKGWRLASPETNAAGTASKMIKRNKAHAIHCNYERKGTEPPSKVVVKVNVVIKQRPPLIARVWPIDWQVAPRSLSTRHAFVLLTSLGWVSRPVRWFYGYAPSLCKAQEC